VEEEKRHTQRFNFSFARKYDHTGSGRLTIHLHAHRAGVRSSWSDGERRFIEDMLGDVVVGIELAADALNRRDAEFEAQRRRAAAERARSEDIERRAAHFKALEIDLRDMAERWARSRAIVAFLDAVDHAIPAAARGEGFAAWLAWARACSREADPLSARRDPEAARAVEIGRAGHTIAAAREAPQANVSLRSVTRRSDARGISRRLG
jgi:hypothetical protein